GTAPITSRTAPAGASIVNFFFKDTKAGTPTLRASSAGLTDATQVETIVAGAASSLGFATAAQTITAGACSAIVTVEARDDFNNPANVGGATTVVLSTTAGASGSFYTNSSCTGAPVPSVSIPAAGTSATFYYRDTAVGTPTLTISNPGLASGTQVETIVPAAPGKLAFTTPPQVLTAGTCSAIATVETQDAFGNRTNVTAATLVTLASSSPTTTFYFDSSCTAAVTSVNVPAGSSAASFYFIDTTAGTATVTVSGSGLTSATQLETFNAGAPVKLGFGNPPRTVAAGACSAAIIVQSQDASGNAASVATSKAVALASSSPAGTFYADSACALAPISGVTIAGGSSSATAYYRDTQVGSPAVTVTAATLGSASQTQTVTPAPAAKLAFVTASQTVTAGTCSAIATVQSRDQFGNPSDASAAIPVALASSSTGGTFYSDSGCTASVTGVTIGAGSRTASFYFKDTRAGSPALTATAAGLTAATQVETIVPGAPLKLAFATPPRTAGAGLCSPGLTVESRDSLDNASPVASAVPVNLSSTSTTVAFFSDSACTAPVSGMVALAGGASAVTFYFRDSTTGPQTVTAAATGFTSASQVETVAAGGAPIKLAFITPPLTLDANACSPAVMVDTQDQNGVTAPVTAALGNVAVALTSASSTLSFYSDPACTLRFTGLTIAVGQFRAKMYLKDTNARPTTITASDQAAVLTSATQNVNVACPLVGTATCDDADLCNGRETCQAGACVPSAPLMCDDGNRCTMDSCQAASGCHNDPVADPTCCVPPAIAEEANPNAVVGVPYRYSASGAARASLGTGPIAWSPCDSPPAGFRIDATTGWVDWTPAAAGTAAVCVAAQGTCGHYEYRFSVTVAPTRPAMPVARLSLTPPPPSSVNVGAPLTADGSLSTGAQPPLYAMELDFGDGSPLAYGAVVNHVYQRGGSYPVRLRVYDSVGQFADATATVKVADASCGSPPDVHIVAPATTGQDRLSVSFTSTYDGTDPGAVYRWDLGDGNTATGPSVNHDYTTGHYTARVTVVSADGCTSVDAVEISVNGAGNRAPYCRLGMTPAAGPAPLPVSYTGVFGDADGDVASATWLFSDGITQDATRYNGAAFRTLNNPGKLGVTLRVVDDRGLVCQASGEAEAANAAGLFAPEIVSTPNLKADCGVAYNYGGDEGNRSVRATGSRLLTWSLGQGGDPAVGVPAGMTIDSNGQIQWVPKKKVAQERVTVVVENAAGVAQQDFMVEVSCPNPDPFVEYCGCTSGAGAAPLALLMLVSLARLRRRRPGRPSRGEDR
ncbi:MAG TPA: PKD domain-containing protein, partial [Myxococcaceae bacterium]|nr:PKD domain-containing protein [Myxococcaceae bacterium]